MTSYEEHIDQIPEHMREGMLNYINLGIPTGSFLEAVLSNDLSKAFSKADSINQHRLGDIVSYVYSFAPALCHGSPEDYAGWIKIGGMKGYKAKANYSWMK